MANEASSSPERQPLPSSSPKQTQAVRDTQSGSADARSTQEGETPRLTLRGLAADCAARNEYEGDSSWQAMHRLAMLVGQDAAQPKAVAQIILTDHDRKFGARAERNVHGGFELQFESTDAQALYKQVMRERQLELASPAENRVSAEQAPAQRSAEPSTEHSARGPQRSPRKAATDAEELRRELTELVVAQDEPGSPTLGPQRERDRQIVERANTEQLRQLKQLANTAQPEEFAQALRSIQKQIERDLTPDDEATTRSAAVRHPLTPPVHERFTVQDRLGRREYWFRDRPDRLGFTENWLTLRTREHSAASLMGMVDRAVELKWKRLHLAGSPEFKREAWILATARDLDTTGYTATLGDREAVEVERQRLSTTRREVLPTEPSKTYGNTLDSESSDKLDGPHQGHERQTGPADANRSQLLRKAMADARVPLELQPRLQRLLERETDARRQSGRAAAVQLWDHAAPRARGPSSPAVKRLVRNTERDR